MKKLFFAILLVGLFVNQASATQWNLNESNVNLGLTGDFATVDISVTGHTATFRVDANQALLGAGNNFGIDKFFFNTTLSTIDAKDFNLAGWKVTFHKEASSFGKFDLEYAGTGKNRVDPLIFTITDNAITNANDFYDVGTDKVHHFAAHVAGFREHNDQTSAFFTDGPTTTPVPEPGTMLLLGAGFLGLAVYGKRRRNA